jgi:hypothetical protein
MTRRKEDTGIERERMLIDAREGSAGREDQERM